MTLVGLAVLLVEGRARTSRPAADREPSRACSLAVAAVRRPPARPLDLPGRVRLRRAAVPVRLRAGADHARRRRRPGRRPDVGRPRRRARRGRVLPRRPRRARADRRPGPRRDRRRTSRSTSSSALVVEAARAAASPPGGRWRSASGPASRSAPSAWPPSGAGRTSGCRSPGRPSCCPRARCSASPPPSPARCSAPGRHRAWRRPAPPRPPSLRRAAVVGAAGVAALVGFALYKPADDGVRADVVADRRPTAARAHRRTPTSA